MKQRVIIYLILIGQSTYNFHITTFLILFLVSRGN